ncbi:MAG TPA: hypothetical protein VH142_20900 [Polyangiaceae bacterium]|jgi:hypothetical protein|nr:hypothetical protein [Polyangiaceae bacterium]
MDDHRLVEVSPKHRIRLASEYAVLLEKPPKRDFVVRTVERREANGLPLMAAEITIAGKETRERYPLAVTYPLHFRKTYFAARLHGDPRLEYESSEKAGSVLGYPAPIGYAAQEFRSCLVPGVPYPRISPFGKDPEDRNLYAARELAIPAAAGLWRLVEQAFQALVTLHDAGLAHGDAELSNFIVCPSPLEPVLVDFETAVARSTLNDADWAERRRLDLAPLLKEALFLQCALGPQPGALAKHSIDEAAKLLKAPERFLRAIDQQQDFDASS